MAYPPKVFSKTHMPVVPQPHVDGAASSAATSAGSLLLGLLLFIMASAIVLSLIPVYLPKKDIPGYTGIQTRSFTLSPNVDVPAYGTLPFDTCNTIVQALGAALGIPSGAITAVSCVVGTSAASGKRRRSLFFRRLPRAGGSNIYAATLIDCTKTNKCSNPGGSGSTVGKGFSVPVTLFGVPVTSFTVVSVQKSAYTSISTVNGTVSG